MTDGAVFALPPKLGPSSAYRALWMADVSAATRSLRFSSSSGIRSRAFYPKISNAWAARASSEGDRSNAEASDVMRLSGGSGLLEETH